MKICWATGLLFLLVTSESVGAAGWFGRAVYNRWHETELERWLSDHNIPYPSPADRKDLENLVKANWETKVEVPLSYASEKGSNHLDNIKNWIFDSWSESSLKAFCDKHGILVPQPRKRDQYLEKARESYETVAKQLGETIAYPGNWLYDQWSDSDLKEWLDERGWPVPQPSSRDRLIAAVRRQSRLASLAAQSAAQASLSDAVFDTWSDSKLKEFLDEHGVKVPQGSKRNELIALARKHRASFLSQASSLSSSAASRYGAATSKAGNEFARPTEDARLKAEDAFNEAIMAWPDSRLKAYLDARGIPVPQMSKRDDLLATVRLYKHKAANRFNAWTFDTWTTENLKKYLHEQNDKVVKKAGATRDDYVKAAQDCYSRASKAGGERYAWLTSQLTQVTQAPKANTFDTWSQSELKHFLDSYGIPVYQGSNLNELKAQAHKQATFFHYGASSPSGALFARIQDSVYWALDQLKFGFTYGRTQGREAVEAIKEQTAKATSTVKKEL